MGVSAAVIYSWPNRTWPCECCRIERELSAGLSRLNVCEEVIFHSFRVSIECGGVGLFCSLRCVRVCVATSVLEVLPPSRVISRSERAASTSSTSFSLLFMWLSEDMMDSLLMWYCPAERRAREGKRERDSERCNG